MISPLSFLNLILCIYFYGIFSPWLHPVACGILVSQPGIEPVSPAVEAWRLNHWNDVEFLFIYLFYSFPCSSVGKESASVQETRVWSLGWEDPLEKEMATHSSILAWKISWTKEPGGLQSMGSQRVGHDWATNTYYSFLNVSTRKCKVTYVAGILFLQDGTVLAIVVQSLSPVQLFVTLRTAAVQHSIDNNSYLGDRCRGSEVKTVHAFSAIFYFFTRGRGAHLRAQALEQSAWPWIRHLTSVSSPIN